MQTSLFAIALTIIVVGVLLFLANKYIPMQEGTKKLLNAFVIIVLIVWILKVVGLWQYLFNVHV